MLADPPTTPARAHAPPEGSPTAPRLLDAHLRAVSQMAAGMACDSGRGFAALAGLWHDLGKRRMGIQRYIRQAGGAEAHIERRVPDREKTHSAAGALWAEAERARQMGPQGQLFSRLLQCVIAAHHAGLDNWDGQGLAARLAGQDAQREYQMATAQACPDDILHPDLSGLVGANRVDWEQISNPPKAAPMGGFCFVS